MYDITQALMEFYVYESEGGALPGLDLSGTAQYWYTIVSRMTEEQCLEYATYLANVRKIQYLPGLRGRITRVERQRNRLVSWRRRVVEPPEPRPDVNWELRHYENPRFGDCKVAVRLYRRMLWKVIRPV